MDHHVAVVLECWLFVCFSAGPAIDLGFCLAFGSSCICYCFSVRKGRLTVVIYDEGLSTLRLFFCLQ
jgi:hypothetical protein